MEPLLYPCAGGQIHPSIAPPLAPTFPNQIIPTAHQGCFAEQFVRLTTDVLTIVGQKRASGSFRDQVRADSGFPVPVGGSRALWVHPCASPNVF